MFLSKKNERGRDKFDKWKRCLYILSNFFGMLPLKTRCRLLDHFRTKKGTVGIALRYAVLKAVARSCGDNVLVQTDVYLLNPQNLSIGNNVSIHPFCYLGCGDALSGTISIGNDVSIAHGVTIMATTHTYEQRDLPIKDQVVISKEVVIKDNCWISAKATIVAGITVESGCVIGANSVITKSTSQDGVYVGSPGVRIKDRKE